MSHLTRAGQPHTLAFPYLVIVPLAILGRAQACSVIFPAVSALTVTTFVRYMHHAWSDYTGASGSTILPDPVKSAHVDVFACLNSTMYHAGHEAAPLDLTFLTFSPWH